MRFPILVVSDLHLGHPACRVPGPEALAPILHDVGTLICNGDTTETVAAHGRRNAPDILHHLRQTVNSAGVQLHLLTGNHDPDLSSHHYLELPQTNVLLTHGDLFYIGLAPWSRAYSRLRPAHLAILNALCPDGAAPTLDQLALSARQTARQGAAYALPLPRSGPFVLPRLLLRELCDPLRLLRLVHTWITAPGHIARTIRPRLPHIRAVLTGHTHRSGVHWRNEMLLINTGSLLPLSGALAVRIEADGKLTIHPLRVNHDKTLRLLPALRHTLLPIR